MIAPRSFRALAFLEHSHTLIHPARSATPRDDIAPAENFRDTYCLWRSIDSLPAHSGPRAATLFFEGPEMSLIWIWLIHKTACQCRISRPWQIRKKTCLLVGSLSSRSSACTILPTRISPPPASPRTIPPAITTAMRFKPLISHPCIHIQSLIISWPTSP